MKYLFAIPFILAVFLVGSLAAPAQADECNKLTYFTFSAPVSLPGVTLPAGTYSFTHPDCTNGILRVTSVDGREVYGTFLTIPEQRMTPRNRPVAELAEMPADAPEAIKAWFYPGETTGDHLIYPKHQMAQVAAAPTRTVLATNGLA